MSRRWFYERNSWGWNGNWRSDWDNDRRGWWRHSWRRRRHHHHHRWSSSSD
jgi:hypothetical protein